MSMIEYWKRVSHDPSAYFEEFSLDFVDENIDYIDTINEQEMRDSNEVNQQRMPVCTTSSSSDESHGLNLICLVCGAPAHGYNFGQITCESCKAFFRRNALRDTATIKCRYSGRCEINAYTRRQCTYCRLKKCFDIQMKKEWIRTDEERQLRRLKILTKEQQKHQLLSSEQISLLRMPIVIRKKNRFVNKLNLQSNHIGRCDMFAIHRHLSDAESHLLNNIKQAYNYGAEQVNFNHITHYTSGSSLSQFLNDESINHQSLVYFFKHVKEFRQFDVDDQILLIKCNFVDIIHLHHIITQNFQELPEMGEHMSNWLSPDFHQHMSHARKQFDCFMKYPLILQITLIVFIFSFNLSLPRGCSQFKTFTDPLKLYEIQNFYATVLWKYLNYLFGEQDATKSMSLIVKQILRYQTLMNIMDEHLAKNNMFPDIMSPLMQSIYGLT